MPEDKNAIASIPIKLVDGLGAVSESSNNLTHALRCAHVAVTMDWDNGIDFVTGTLGVLLFAAEDVSSRAEKLHEEAENILRENHLVRESDEK